MRRVKKGFTMLELLAAVVILGILSVLAIVSISRLINSANRESDEDYEKMLKIAAQSYMETNKNGLPKRIGNFTYVTSEYLKSRNYLKEDKGGCVEVKKSTNTKYSYTVKKTGTCRSSEGEGISCLPAPVIVKAEITDSDLNPIDMNNPESQSNLQNALLYLNINGGTEGGKKLKIEGYNYSILIKTESEEEFHEVYNSGTLSANGETDITVKRRLKEFIDVTEANEIDARVTVINEKGCASNDTPEQSILNDKIAPSCLKVEGAAKDENDWINKSDIDGGRIISINCDDGNGSGCVRDTFVRTWPNDYQQDAEWAYIQAKDNAGNVSVSQDIYNSTDICNASAQVTDSCRVRVNVDKTNPSIKILGIFQSDKSGNKSTVDINNHYNSPGKQWTDSTGNGSIGTNDYNNIEADSFWMNNKKYPNGVVYEIEISDNIHLDKWTWETNPSYITSVNDPNYGVLSVNNDGYRQNVSGSVVNWKGNCGTKSRIILIGFKDEGRRQGKLTVYDKAGNKLTLTISANLDRQSPPVPLVEYSEGYKPEIWSKKQVITSIPSSYKRDDTSGPSEKKVTLSGWSHFVHQVRKDYDKNFSLDEKGQDFTFDSKYQGKNQIQYYSCDMANNCSSGSGYKGVWVDFTKPVCEVKKATSASITGVEGWVGAGSKVSVTSTCTEVASNKESGCYNGTGTNDIKSSYKYDYTSDINTGIAGAKGNGDGGKIRDIAGNETTCLANQSVKIDTKKPNCVVTGESTTWALSRTIYRTCSDSKVNNVASGCTSASTITDKYQEKNKTVKTVSFVPYTVMDKAGNSLYCSSSVVGKTSLNVYVDKQAPTCKVTKYNTTHSDGTHSNAQGNPKGVGIKYECDDAGVGGQKCPTNDPAATATKSTPVADALGNPMTCTATVYSKKEYRYRKKDAAATCSKSCCGYKTCRTSACGCQTYNSKCNIGTCGGYYRYKHFTASSLKSCGGGYAIYDYSKYSYKQKYDCEWHANYEYCKYRTVTTYSIHCRKMFCRTCRHERHGCQTYYSCTSSACGNKTCTSSSCCGYKCGTSHWNAWGGKDNKCNSEYRLLYY